MSELPTLTVVVTIEQRYDVALGSCVIDSCRRGPTHTIVLDGPCCDESEVPICAMHVDKYKESRQQ